MKVEAVDEPDWDEEAVDTVDEPDWSEVQCFDHRFFDIVASL